MNYERAYNKLTEAINEKNNEEMKEKVLDIEAIERYYKENPDKEPDGEKPDNHTQDTNKNRRTNMNKILDEAKVTSNS